MRAADAEVLGGGPVTIRLLVDSESTDGAITANRTLLRQGASGPPPHYHAGSAEILFILAGSLQALAGDGVVALSEGDFLVIPRQMPHAFAAPPQADGGHPMTVTARRPVRPRVRLTNRIVTMLLRLGVPLGAVRLLIVPGRKSRMPRTTPVATFTFEGAHYLMQGYPGAGWVASAGAAGQGLLGGGLGMRPVMLVEVPVAERRVILGHLARTAPGSAARLVESCLIESADPESFAASAATIAVFRVGDLA